VLTDLLGTWQLRQWTVTDGAGRRYPFGEHATGVLLYGDDGQMMVAVSAADRPPLSTEVPRRAAAGELATAFLGFFCYAGRWYTEDGWVVHLVDLALNPALVGTVQRRRVELDGTGGLDLVAEESLDGRTRSHRLSWHRPT
jgi:hypothetical protein